MVTTMYYKQVQRYDTGLPYIYNTIDTTKMTLFDSIS